MARSFPREAGLLFASPLLCQDTPVHLLWPPGGCSAVPGLHPLHTRTHAVFPLRALRPDAGSGDARHAELELITEPPARAVAGTVIEQVSWKPRAPDLASSCSSSDIH